KLIFKVLKRGARLEEELVKAGAGRASELADLGMRYDLTVPLARFVANHLNELPMPFKVAHAGPVWRAERPQRGRYREFTQCDIDIVGEASVAAEVELCAATVEAMERIGIRGCTVRLNDRRLLRAAVEQHLGPLGPAALATAYVALDKLDKIGPDGVAAELEAAGHDASTVQRLLVALKVAMGGRPGGETVSRDLDPVAADVQRTLASLDALGLSARFDPVLVRGMGYYTGLVFELSHPAVSHSLAGGGRYDGMTARFGAPALPMCGLSIGFDRVFELVDQTSLGGGRRKEFVVCATDEELLRALEKARARRGQEPDLTLSVVRRARNTRKQRDDFQRLGYAEGQLFPK
ncbi:MAG TPA: ATP phosphoribosyltransferase regulatory subunit, partial [Acidimicrobiales bacterium]|nr:ATP phosphoribosyltransferase regulatory subunit [Acidimicrobiales bacterium]